MFIISSYFSLLLPPHCLPSPVSTLTLLPSLTTIHTDLLPAATSGHLRLLQKGHPWLLLHFNSSFCLKNTLSKSLPWAYCTKRHLTLQPTFPPLLLPYSPDHPWWIAYLFMSFSCCLNTSSYRAGALFCSLLCLQHQEQCLEYSNSFLNEWISDAMRSLGGSESSMRVAGMREEISRT